MFFRIEPLASCLIHEFDTNFVNERKKFEPNYFNFRQLFLGKKNSLKPTVNPISQGIDLYAQTHVCLISLFCIILCLLTKPPTE